MLFRNPAAEFVYYRTYSRWNDTLGRRETWPETVDRVISFLSKKHGEKVPTKVFRKLKKYMLAFDVMPSMRLTWAAGDAADSHNMTIFNCSAAAACYPKIFSEALYILMCGAGFGYSVERKYTDQLPAVSHQTGQITYHTIADSKEGWQESVRLLTEALYNGSNVEFDYSQIRPKGSRLRVMGGRASGPEPLATLHVFMREIFARAQGRRLEPVEVSDLLNKVAEIVVVGGVRRSSQIALSDLSDEQMRNAKEWPFPLHRAMANHSAVYYEKPDAATFLKEWMSLVKNRTGERGIFNLGSLRDRAPSRRDKSLIALTNPCGEIALRNQEVCNLSSVIIRAEDDLLSVIDKIQTATWLGVIQSCFTDFHQLDSNWKKNADEERLLGVSLSGQMDNPRLLTASNLKVMKVAALKTAKHAADLMGIPMPAAVTCTKPEGTSSQVTGSSSGLHTWFAPYFIRRYRISSIDPLCKMLRDQGVPMNPEVGQAPETASTWVVEFPVKAPPKSLTKTDMSAIEQLEHYKKIQKHWCEHNASCTIYYQDDEAVQVGSWVYDNWDIACGLSFLPASDHKYELAPLEEITKEEYEAKVKEFPKIDYSQLSKYELEDQTTGAQVLACSSGGTCEI